MRRLLALLLVLAGTSNLYATGILIPVEKKVPPLAMVDHKVTITIEDQVAITSVEQTFRNHTDRQLEATYIFPVPKEAGVQKLSMWIDGKEVGGELVEAAKARKIYTDIVQRTQDPALLEYMGHNLLKLRVFPILAHKDQKIAFRYSSVVPADSGLVNYTYPLKTEGKAIQTLEKFSINVTLKSQHALQNIYSPTHPITVTRSGDREARVTFDKAEAFLDRNFELFYTAGSKDVGLTTLTHRPVASGKGYFMLLVSPRNELSKEQQVPRDVVLVLDTSGSMRGKRMTQARHALNYCLTNLNSKDRFAIINFATTVNKYSEQLLPVDDDHLKQAKKWVDNLEATGGTAINDALAAALDMRTNDPGRTFTVVFFTDGRPTIGETDSDKILKNVAKRNSGNTRIFTFGVGDDVNASMLDQLAEESRAVSTFVRETEDIEAKVSGLYAKISHPVLTNLKLTVGEGVKVAEIYPPQLPDLFHGSQLVVLGRYDGSGHAAVKVSGSVGKEQKEFVYELNFPKKTEDEKPFVEDLWARRKVGYLLDQIRLNGEKDELVKEVVSLAKRYGITTPYTSYLIVPDAPTPVAAASRQAGGLPGKGKTPDVSFHFAPGGGGGFPGAVPPVLTGPKTENTPGQPTANFGTPITVEKFAKEAQLKAGDGAKAREDLTGKDMKKLDKLAEKDGEYRRLYSNLDNAKQRWEAYNQASQLLKRGDKEGVQGGRLGVDLSIDANNLRNQQQLTQSAVRRVAQRNCLDIGGVWIDEAYSADLKTVAIKAMSPAYFRILERHPQVKEVYSLGNHLVWVTPSGRALIVDTTAGREELPDTEIDALFTAKK